MAENKKSMRCVYLYDGDPKSFNVAGLKPTLSQEEVLSVARAYSSLQSEEIFEVKITDVKTYAL